MEKTNESKEQALHILKNRFKLGQNELVQHSSFLENEFQAKKLCFALLQFRFITHDTTHVNRTVAKCLPFLIEFMTKNKDIEISAIVDHMVFLVIPNL